jgi:SAM-dependent methyltransferase
MNPLARAALGFLSFKRQAVDRLAGGTRAGSRVVDLGAGQGGYSHWFLGRRAATIVALDWSFAALAAIAPPRRGKILRVCADAQALPLKPASADALFSVDTLGHLAGIPAALDEMGRVVKAGGRLYLHSECANYRARWPDRMLERRIGYDFLAAYDGHHSLLTCEELRSLYAARFRIDRLWSAAGVTGWLTGYPEKYRLAFTAAGCRGLAALTALFALLKRLPPAGGLLRLVNSTINRLELAMGIQGGGSCSALLRKPGAGS